MFRTNNSRNKLGKTTAYGVAAIILCLLIAQSLSAEEHGASDQIIYPILGSPDAVENQLTSDRADRDVLFESRFLTPYFEWKEGIKEKYGLSFAVDYTSVYLTANSNMQNTDDYSSGGMVRFFGTWEMFGRGTPTTGALSYKIEHRHSYSDTVPASFSLESLGYVDSIASTFNDQEWRLTNLHWRQGWGNGKVVLLTGFLSVPDFLDIFTLGSPWLHYQSLAFSTGSGTISLPGDAALGAIVGGWLNDNLYLMGGLEDANSLPDDPFEGFDTFFKENEYFKHIEIGWTTSRDKAYLDNFHLTIWHVDEREEAGVDDGWGGVLSFTHYLGDRWMPFVRAAYANGGNSLLERSVSAGFAFQPNPVGSDAGNLLGFGANWGKPNEAIYGSGLDDQYALELFYRLQVTKELAITPDIQFQINPALNPDEDNTWVFGLRMRLAL